MSPGARPPRRRALIASVVGLVVALAGLGLVVGVVRPAGEQATAQDTPDALAPVATFPSAAAVQPGATPGIAVTIPLTRPDFPYVGSAPWQLRHPSGGDTFVEGFASRPSYLPGDVLRLAVNTSALTYRVRIFRVSGDAPAASPFVEVARIPPAPGIRQAGPIVDPATKMVRAPWRYTTTFAIPADWPSGVYLARLSSDEDVQSYVPFVVRSASPTRFLVVSNALTWQAYNPWGGSDLYGTNVGQPIPGVGRALAVSFDRPYASDGGAGQLFLMELPMIAWLERQHLDVSFTTDYDLSVDPGSQPLPRAVLFNGHSEYWGVPLRLWLERHVLQAGDMRLGAFAANSGYWPVVLSGGGPDGPRVVTCYKGGPLPASAVVEASAAADASAATGASAATEASPSAEEPTASDQTTLAPAVEDEPAGGSPLGSFPPTGPYDGPYVGSYDAHSLFGVAYQHVTTAMADYTLADPVPQTAPQAALLAGLLAGTGIAPGSPLGFFAGGEVDATVGGGSPSAPGTVGGAGSTGVIAGAYGIPSRNGDISTAEAVWRALPNGSAVFASGTFYWGWALDPRFAAGHDVVPGFERLTLNILTVLGS